MAKKPLVKGVDVPIVKLTPLHKRKPSKTGFKKLVASIKAVGIVEPLYVFQEGGIYIILNGYLRYLACLELGIEVVPCIITNLKDAYTPNRMVNHISKVQEARMLNKSLEVLDKKTIANAFGLSTIKHRLNDKLLKQIHPQVANAFDKKRISKACVEELTFVKPARQCEILKEMQKVSDFSPAYARTLILRTPPPQRNKNGRKKNPWDHRLKQKKELTAKLEEAEQRHDFYTLLYRQYVTDLLKLCIYVRMLITNDRIVAYLNEHHPDILERFQEILFETEGKKQAI